MKFHYSAVRIDGKKTSGIVEATNAQQAMAELRSNGIYVIKIKDKGALRVGTGSGFLSQEIHFGTKVNNQEFVAFTRQFAALIQAGVPLANSVKVLMQQTKNKAFANVLADVAVEIEKGNQLSRAVSKHKKIFPQFFVSMMKAAEASGNLDEALERVAIFFEREHYTREKIKSALVYPVVVTILAICVTVFLLIKVVPTFVTLFASFHAQLPVATRIVLATSAFVSHMWYLILTIVALLLLCYNLAIRKNSFLFVRDMLILKTPVFGKLIAKSLIARLARTLGLLLSSSVPILSAIKLASNVLDNQVMARALASCDVSLRSGRTLSEPLSKQSVIPPLVIQMIKVGEETGTIDVMLSKIADFYESETETAVDRLKSLLEPVMVVALSVIVGTIVLAIIQPMFSLYQHIGAMS